MSKQEYTCYNMILYSLSFPENQIVVGQEYENLEYRTRKWNEYKISG